MGRRYWAATEEDSQQWANGWAATEEDSQQWAEGIGQLYCKTATNEHKLLGSNKIYKRLSHARVNTQLLHYKFQLVNFGQGNYRCFLS